MTLISDAKSLYVGDASIQSVMAGDKIVWPVDAMLFPCKWYLPRFGALAVGARFNAGPLTNLNPDGVTPPCNTLTQTYTYRYRLDDQIGTWAVFNGYWDDTQYPNKERTYCYLNFGPFGTNQNSECWVDLRKYVQGTTTLIYEESVRLYDGEMTQVPLTIDSWKLCGTGRWGFNEDGKLPRKSKDNKPVG